MSGKCADPPGSDQFFSESGPWPPISDLMTNGGTKFVFSWQLQPANETCMYHLCGWLFSKTVQTSYTRKCADRGQHVLISTCSMSVGACSRTGGVLW